MRKRLAAMVMAAVLAGSSMMGCAGSGALHLRRIGEPQNRIGCGREATGRFGR